MTSAIDASFPVQGSAYTATVRTQFATAKAEISALQSQLEIPGLVFNSQVSGTMTANVAALQAAIDTAALGSHNSVVVRAPTGGATRALYLNAGITIDWTKLNDFDMGGCALHFENAADGTIYITGTGSQWANTSHYGQGIATLRNGLIIGNGAGQTSIGYTSLAAGNFGDAYMAFENVFFTACSIAERHGVNSYLIKHWHCTYLDFGTAVLILNAANSGENMSWSQCNFAGGLIPISCANANADLYFDQCSFDFNSGAPGLLSVTGGRVEFDSCHFESVDDTLNYVVASGNGTTVRFKGGILQINAVIPQAMTEYFNITAPAVVYLDNLLMHNLQNSNERLATGSGLIIARETHFYNTANMPTRLSDNQLCSAVRGTLTSGSFANPMGDFVTGAADWTNRLTGTNLVLTRSTTYSRSGTLTYTSQTVNFTVGETITEATSGATAVIVSDSDAGSTGTLTIWKCSKPFTGGLAITGGLGGAATGGTFTPVAALAATKSGGVAAAASFLRHIPIRDGELDVISWRNYDFNPGAVTGTYLWTTSWVRLERDEAGIPNAVWLEAIATSSAATPSSTVWTARSAACSGQGHAPSWATHYRLTFDLTAFGNGALYFDDFVASRW